MLFSKDVEEILPVNEAPSNTKRMLRLMPHLLLPSALLITFLTTTAIGADVEYINNGRGAVPVYLPSNYDGSKPLPLIFSLHGYTDNGPGVESYFNLSQQVDSKEFLYCVPQGTTDLSGAPFWNGTDACCDIFNTNVDDSGYLRELIEIIQAEYSVDEFSIHFTGISNGGFMSYRMACEHADLVASIAPLAGVTFLDLADCSPSEPVHVLHIHGTADSTIEYDGGCFFFSCYPGAEESALTWTDYNGCDLVGEDGGPAFNLDWDVGGNETTSTIYEQNCNQNATVELWTMTGSEHVPRFRRNSDGPEQNLFAPLISDWLLNHRKPEPFQCDADLNDDGVIDTDDLLAMLSAWGSNDPAADLDENNIVNIKDLLILLGDFGKVC